MTTELFGVIAILPFIAWIGSALLTSWLASELDRPGGIWFLLGLVFGPIALVAVGFAGRSRGRPAA
jgi:hypothetical protein